MKFNPKLKADLEKYMGYPIIVEGKKHVILLNELGFDRVYAIHEDGISIPERVNHLSSIIPKREKVCILTDLDRRGKKLYFEIKELCKEFGIQTDSTLRGLLLVSDINHIEKLKEFVEKASGVVKNKKKNWERR